MLRAFPGHCVFMWLKLQLGGNGRSRRNLIKIVEARMAKYIHPKFLVSDVLFPYTSYLALPNDFK
jgi:hypothetical protein